jgi:CDP-paratose 2-epimerase
MHILITGGAGFIGANLAAALIRDGYRVTLYDNLSRPGAAHNLAWLTTQFGSDKVVLRKGDIRDAARTTQALADADAIIHLAGQVAVTTSVANPREDFDINALGTFNVLEAARTSGKNPILLYSSTNKVYGGMDDIVVVEDATRYRYRDLPRGVTEAQPLDFHSPYGCSKGTGDQYVRDYHRIYDLRTVVFRQSAIYGPRQFGVEDQGWAAHFIIATQLGRPLSIYGDGKQVRDLLYVDDLVDAYRSAIARIDTVAGEIFNIGGGPDNTISIWREFHPHLDTLNGKPVATPRFADWRPGDQRVCILNIDKAQQALQWEPRISITHGIERLWQWVADSRAEIEGR